MCQITDVNFDYQLLRQLIMKVWSAKSKRTEERKHGRTDEHRKKLNKKTPIN